MKNLSLVILIVFISFSGCKSIKKNKVSANLEEDIKTEQVEEVVETSKIVDEDKSESEFVEEVVEQTVTRQEMIVNPVTNEVLSSPVVTTTVKRKSSGKERLDVKKIESVNNNVYSSFNQNSDKESNDSELDKQSEGQDAGEIVGTVSKFALEGIFKGLFGNALKMLTSIVIVILLVIVFIKRKKDNKGS
jgi:uncharacterized membrane protein